MLKSQLLPRLLPAAATTLALVLLALPAQADDESVVQLVDVVLDDDDELDTPSNPDTADDDDPTLPPTVVEGEQPGDVDVPLEPFDPEPQQSLTFDPSGPISQSAIDSAGNTSTITAERIDRIIASDIDDIFRYEPGVTVQSSTGRFGIGSINVRGLEGNRVLIQTDGVRVPDAFQQGPTQLGRDALDITFLKSVDIFRGPGSLIYGEGAIGGAVVFNTKDPEDYLNVFGKNSYVGINSSYFSADASWANTGIIALRLTEKLEAMVGYTRRDGNDLESRGAFPTDLQRIESDYVLGKLVYHLNDCNKVKFATEWFNNNVSTRLDSTLGNTVVSAPGAPGVSLINFGPGPPLIPIFPPGLGFADRTSNFAEDESDRIRYSLTWDYNDCCNQHVQRARFQVYYQEYNIRSVRLQQFVGTDPNFPLINTPPNFPPWAGTPIANPSDDTFAQDMLGARLRMHSDFCGPFNRFHKLVYGVDMLKTDTVRLRTGQVINQTNGMSQNTNSIGEATPSKPLPDVTIWRVGLYIKDEIELREGGLTVTPGVRIDYYDQDVTPDALFFALDPQELPQDISEWNAQPIIELKAPLADNLLGVTRYARGYRAPPVEDAAIGFTNPAIGYTILPNPNLRSETSDAIDLGFSHSGQNTAMYVGGYYNHYNDFIENVALGPDPVTGLLRFQQRNLEAQTYGVEFAGQVLLSPLWDPCSCGYGWSLYGNFTYVVGDNLTDDIPLDSIPPMNAVVSLRYRAYEDVWGFEIPCTLVHGKDRPSGTITDQFVPGGYAVFDALAYVNVNKHIKVNLGVYNIFDREYYRWLNVRGVTTSQADLTRFAAPGINFAGNVRIEW